MRIVKCKLKEKLGNVIVVEVDAVHAVHIRKIHLPQENPITLQREICKKCNGNANKILDGLPISVGQVQHGQTRQTWPRAVAENDHSCYDRDQEQCTQQKS